MLKKTLRTRTFNIITFLALTAIAAVAFAQSAVEHERDQTQQQQQQPARPGSQFPDLVGGLKATPGCLGVETAQTSSGKNVIFAWFENKKAALNWYYSDMHKQVMSIIQTGEQQGDHHASRWKMYPKMFRLWPSLRLLLLIHRNSSNPRCRSRKLPLKCTLPSKAACTSADDSLLKRSTSRT